MHYMYFIEMNIKKRTIFGKLDKTVPVFISLFLYSSFRNEGKQFIKWVCLEEQTGWTKGGKASVSVTPALPMGWVKSEVWGGVHWVHCNVPC